MKKYNRALDCVTLAMAFAAKGKVVESAKMFTKAMAQPDVKRAIATLEASNQQAFAIEASAQKTETEAKQRLSATAKKPKVTAAKKVTAGDDIDMGDDEDLDALLGDDMPEEDEGEMAEAAVDEDEMDEEDDEGDFDGAEFAKVLAGMTKPVQKAKRK